MPPEIETRARTHRIYGSLAGQGQNAQKARGVRMCVHVDNPVFPAGKRVMR
jgi:hypothetical protein